MRKVYLFIVWAKGRKFEEKIRADLASKFTILKEYEISWPWYHSIRNFTFFYRHMKKLIEEGHVYLATPPLYKVFKGKNVRYAFSDEERDFYIQELGGTNVQAERYKGLGEMDPEQLRDTTMDPRFRTLKRVDIEDAMACDEAFSLLMGDQVEPRRDFIEKNAKYVENLDV